VSVASRRQFIFKFPRREPGRRTGILNVLRNTVATEIATNPSRRISAPDSNWRLFRLQRNSCVRVKYFPLPLPSPAITPYRRPLPRISPYRPYIYISLLSHPLLGFLIHQRLRGSVAPLRLYTDRMQGGINPIFAIGADKPGRAIDIYLSRRSRSRD